MKKAHAQPNENIHAGRDEIKHTVIAPELAPTELDLTVNPVRIDDVLGKGRSDTDGQDPRKRPAECARKDTGDYEAKIASVIKGPAQAAHRAPASRYRPIQEIRYQRHHPRGQSEKRRPLVSFRHEERERDHQKEANGGEGISHPRSNLSGRRDGS